MASWQGGILRNSDSGRKERLQHRQMGRNSATLGTVSHGTIRKLGQKDTEASAGVPQGSVLGPIVSVQVLNRAQGDFCFST